MASTHAASGLAHPTVVPTNYDPDASPADDKDGDSHRGTDVSDPRRDGSHETGA